GGLAVLGVENLAKRFALPPLVPNAFLAAILILCSVRTYYRNFDWRSDITLAEATIKTSPNAFRAYEVLAFSLYGIDPTTSLDRIVELGKKSVDILEPLPAPENSSPTYLHLGIYYGMKGEMNASRTADGFVVM